MRGGDGRLNVISPLPPLSRSHLVEGVDDGLEEVVEEEGDGEGDENGPQDKEDNAWRRKEDRGGKGQNFVYMICGVCV